jgi:hypothetical protein
MYGEMTDELKKMWKWIWPSSLLPLYLLEEFEVITKTCQEGQSSVMIQTRYL